MHHSPLLSIILMALILGCSAPAPSQSQPAHPSEKASAPKRVTVAIRGDPDTLSSKISPTGGGSVPGVDALEELLSAGLVHADGQGRLRPQLGEALPSVENGLWRVFPDGRMEIVWRIRENAHWQDGRPISAADLLFTTQIEQDRQLAVLNHAAYDDVESVEAIDSRTVVVKWQRPYIEADTMFSRVFALPVPRHLLERAYVDERASFLEHAYWREEIVGSGPFRLKDWLRGSHLVLEANPLYVLGRPRIDEIEVRFVTDHNTVIANVLSGAVDLTMGRGGLSVEQGIQARDQWRGGAMLLRPLGWVPIFPQFVNPSPPIVSDVRFRRALLHAIDRQELADSVQHGLVAVAHSYVGPNEPEYPDIEASIVRYEYDPRRAGQMIEELGYRRAGPDGPFRDPAGQPLAVELRTLAQNDIHAKTMFPVADYWQRVGVSVDPVIVSTQRQRDREYRATFPSFEMYQLGNNLSSTSLGRFHSSRSSLSENSFQINGNNARYINRDFDALIERFFQTIPRQERTRVLGQIVHHQTDQLSVMGIFYSASAILVSNRLQGVGVGSATSTEAWNAHEWDLSRPPS